PPKAPSPPEPPRSPPLPPTQREVQPGLSTRASRPSPISQPPEPMPKIAKGPAVAKVSTPRDAPSAADSQPGVSGTHSASVFASFTCALLGAGLSGGTESRTPSPPIAVPVTPAAKY